MDVLVYLVGVLVLVQHVESWYYPVYGAFSCTCNWKHGGKCKPSCDRGEFVLGKLPCAFGYLGTCCATKLPCSDHGGICRTGGCSNNGETEYTYKVKCPGSKTCCLRQALSTNILPLRSVNSITPAVCGGRTLLSQRILGGALVSSSCQWPWMVSIKLGTRRNPGPFICAGVLISKNKVITTANCVLRRQVFVTVGEIDPNVLGENEEHEIDVRRTTISPKFNRALAGRPLQRGDLAILTLSSSISSGGCAQPVCLPRNNDVVTDTSRCFMAGWGYNSRNSKSLPSRLVEANVNVVSHRLCSLVLALGANTELPTDKICSSPFVDGADACPGDNGGMLVCEDKAHGGVWNLHGIISDNACSETLPVVYTNLQSHLQWLQASVYRSYHTV